MVQSTPLARRSRTAVVTAFAACVAAVAGVVIVVLLSFGGGAGTAHAAATPPHPTPAHTTPAHTTPAHTTPAHTAPAGTVPAPKPSSHVAVLPAAQVRTIQQELASLNYYEGPINGVMTPQTVQAITYLQRDAQLPQNGEWNQVTYLAMQQMLATGNNQMAG